MSNTSLTYEGLFDMMRDQLLHICNKELTPFLKEHSPSSLQQMATLAYQFKEARLTRAVSLTSPGVMKCVSTKTSGVSDKYTSASKKTDSGFSSRKGERRCFKCTNPSHIATIVH